ncbi:Uncharacterized protein Rs2_39767 [Raphanus sativus]|nr:Uncharacterized protein Rs2_39767 [Raphanus sativus]
MGQDYSYSQPSSSSNSVDITSLIEAEAQLYADEAESSHFNAEPLQYQPQPECDDGIPRTCYCGAEPWELRELKGALNESEQKVVILEKTVTEFTKKKPGVKLMEY